MIKKGSITIKELHAQTGEHVRRAGRGRSPLPVTDRGKVVAALVPPTLLPPTSSVISMPCAAIADDAVLYYVSEPESDAVRARLDAEDQRCVHRVRAEYAQGPGSCTETTPSLSTLRPRLAVSWRSFEPSGRMAKSWPP